MLNIKSNHSELFTALKRRLEDKELLQNLIRNGLQLLLPAVKERIHQLGNASDGRSIGAYDVKPMYGKVTTGAAGKNGKTTFKTRDGQRREYKSQYYPSGYAEYKLSAGLSTEGQVNLLLTGALRDGLIVIQSGSEVGLGWYDGSLHRRAKALEAKYKKPIWGLTDGERELLIAHIKNGYKNDEHR